jgi:L-threonylcarbamoyladenylate synthase
MRHWHWGDDLNELREILDRGQVLVIPTESSYGLAVDPRSQRGVEAIYRLKGRELGKALPVVAADFGQISDLGVNLDSPGIEEWVGHWPAPLSLVLSCSEDLPAAAGSGSLAVRIPAHERLRSLLSGLGTSLTATSANLSGLSPVLNPEELGSWLVGEKVVIVNDGSLPGGAPSTVIRLALDGEWSLLRQGRFPLEKISA